MNPAIQPYLFFNGRCEEAIGFYQAALAAKVEMMLRFRDNPETPPPGTMPPNWGDKVMHCTLRVGNALVLASDGCETGAKFSGFSLSLNVASQAEAERVFHALAAGGTVTMPLAKTFWSPCFGMLTDRFGVGWMIGLAG